MKTDSLFYELFEFDPRSLFQLVQLDIKDEYIFESITVKTTEKRFDGFFKNKEGKGPHVFLKVQGYDDPKIYWRLFREICTYYELKDDSTEFIALVIFLEKDYDPGAAPLSCVSPNRFVRVFLSDMFKLAGDKAGSLTVLKPLIFDNKIKLITAVQQWKTEIKTLNLTRDRENKLLELLEYAIVQRFPGLTSEEVQTMLKLTPIDQTVIGRELLNRGREDGREEGREEGEKKGILIGEILMAQRLLKYPFSAKEELTLKSIEELQDILRQLESGIE